MSTETKQEVAVTTKGKGHQLERSIAAPILRQFEDMERMLDRMMSGSWLRPFSWDRPLWSEFMHPQHLNVPRVDVLDRDQDILVRAEIPGVDKKDLDVSLSDDMLTIKGQVSREEKEERADYYRCEISRGSFLRTVTLPAKVDGSKASAQIKDGVLEVAIPKTEGSKRHSIAVD